MEETDQAAGEAPSGLDAGASRLASELHYERAQLGAVIESIPAGLVIALAPAGTIELANQEAARIFGVDALESLESAGEWKILRLDGTEYGHDDLPLVRSLRSAEVVTEEAAEIVRRDGERLAVEINSAPIRDSGGGVAAAVAIFRDVTGRELRRRAEREFVTNAAHELQTPLTAIIAAVEVLQSGAKEIPSERDRFLAHIQSHSHRLARLAHALLLLTRAELGLEKPRDELIELGPFLDEIALAAPAKPGVEVVVHCGPGLSVSANPELLEQAVLNLALNATKYTPQGRIELSAARRGSKVAIEVRDTGSGIPAGNLKQVFDRFYRSGPSGAEAFGLGLAIVRQAVDALGGEVSVRSKEGAGTTVRIALPAAPGKSTT